MTPGTRSCAFTGRVHVSIAIPQLIGGGAEKLTTNLASLFAREGVLSRLYTGNLAGAERLAGVEVVDLAAPRALGAALRLRSALTADPAGTFLLTLGYVNLAPILRLARPHTRIVLRIGNTMTPELRTLGTAARLRYRLALWLATRFADLIIVQCDYMGEDLARHLPHARGKLATVYNFVEEALWDYQPPRERPLAARYLFTAASFKPQKAHDVLLAAFARSQPRREGVRLVVAGVPRDHQAFAALMCEHGLSDEEVIRTGFITDPYRWIAHAELCVLASRYEGFSNFLVECAALGKRIVATSCPGGNAELFIHYPNVTEVPVDDVDALAAALAQPRRDLDRSLARDYLRPFAQDHIYGRYLDLLIGSAGGPPAEGRPQGAAGTCAE